MSISELKIDAQNIYSVPEMIWVSLRTVFDMSHCGYDPNAPSESQNADAYSHRFTVVYNLTRSSRVLFLTQAANASSDILPSLPLVQKYDSNLLNVENMLLFVLEKRPSRDTAILKKKIQLYSLNIVYLIK